MRENRRLRSPAGCSPRKSNVSSVIPVWRVIIRSVCFYNAPPLGYLGRARIADKGPRRTWSLDGARISVYLGPTTITSSNVRLTLLKLNKTVTVSSVMFLGELVIIGDVWWLRLNKNTLEILFFCGVESNVKTRTNAWFWFDERGVLNCMFFMIIHS